MIRISNPAIQAPLSLLSRTFRHLLAGIAVFLLPASAAADNPPLFPTDIAATRQGDLVMTESGRNRLAVYAADGNKLLKAIALPEPPTGICVEGDNAYVTTHGSTGHLQFVSLAEGKCLDRIFTGSGATAPVLAKDKRHLYVCNQFQNTVSEIDLAKKTVTRTVAVLREPKALVASNDGRFLFVMNYLPALPANLDYVAACVSVVDAKSFTKVKDIMLANGSNALRGICITPDGKYLYVSHNLGRFTVPTSQLQQGWMNTSAFSIIDVAQQKCLGTVVADEPERGAAGIWGIACNEEKIFISHSGTHDISVIDHKALTEKFLAYPDKQHLDYDLNFLYGIRERIPLQGNGPRNMLLCGNRLFIPTYFADVLNTFDTRSGLLAATPLNPQRTETPENKGERIFNDAAKCFQNWQSCNGCHPDARTDGMNWDLMNDGVGNSKNCKSMLFSHMTPPNMISGIREHAERAVRAGFNFIQFFEVEEEDAVCVDAYLKALKPVPSPYLVDGKLSPLAQRGQKVFDELKCGECHSGVYFTDMKMHRIGEDIEFEKGWDTPTLREAWRTAPYLFDGRAATMQEVFSVHKHGIEKKVSKKDIEALTEYVNSL